MRENRIEVKKMEYTKLEKGNEKPGPVLQKKRRMPAEKPSNATVSTPFQI